LTVELHRSSMWCLPLDHFTKYFQVWWLPVKV